MKQQGGFVVPDTINLGGSILTAVEISREAVSWVAGYREHYIVKY
jgi:hypothetical protein